MYIADPTLVEERITGAAQGEASDVALASVAAWAVVCNKYFSTVVRIQRERGHQVVTDGPYRYVRHPGYAGFVPRTVREDRA